MGGVRKELPLPTHSQPSRSASSFGAKAAKKGAENSIAIDCKKN